MIFSLCSALASFAQGNGMAGISEATNMVTSYFDPLTKLIFAVAAILGLVGGVRVYSKFSSGDPDASKSATALFLSCVFLVIVGTVLRSFPGISRRSRLSRPRCRSRRSAARQRAAPSRPCRSSSPRRWVLTLRHAYQKPKVIGHCIACSKRLSVILLFVEIIQLVAVNSEISVFFVFS